MYQEIKLHAMYGQRICACHQVNAPLALIPAVPLLAPGISLLALLQSDLCKRDLLRRGAVALGEGDLLLELGRGLGDALPHEGEHPLRLDDGLLQLLQHVAPVAILVRLAGLHLGLERGNLALRVEQLLLVRDVLAQEASDRLRRDGKLRRGDHCGCEGKSYECVLV